MAEEVDPAIFGELEEFFFADEFANDFETWAKGHSHKFSSDVSISSEQKLEYMDVYKEFVAMYEGKLDSFVKAKGLDLATFQAACARELSEGESPNAFILRVIQATAEYETFLQMMAEVAQREEAGGT
mmetsp:Transcript_1196/g.3401  ORF Transcript_1196/g.3401 Transcript_1196/m.3401 type:complete len:128 (+) Transcript_1196:41-424(+)